MPHTSGEEGMRVPVTAVTFGRIIGRTLRLE